MHNDVRTLFPSSSACRGNFSTAWKHLNKYIAPTRCFVRSQPLPDCIEPRCYSTANHRSMAAHVNALHANFDVDYVIVYRFSDTGM